MSFPVQPSDPTSRALVETSATDLAPNAPAPHARDTLTPRLSIWALVGATCGIVTTVGVCAADFNITAAEILCVAAGPALIGGLAGLVTISESSGRLKGRGFAVIGVVMGVVGLIVLTRLMSSQLAAHFEQYPPFSFPSDD